MQWIQNAMAFAVSVVFGGRNSSNAFSPSMIGRKFAFWHVETSTKVYVERSMSRRLCLSIAAACPVSTNDHVRRVIELNFSLPCTTACFRSIFKLLLALRRERVIHFLCLSFSKRAEGCVHHQQSIRHLPNIRITIERDTIVFVV